MAETAAVPKEVSDEALGYLADARQEKQQFLTDFTEVFQFCFPQRVRPQASSVTTTQSRTNAAFQVYTDIGPMVTADFASDISDTFAPEHTPWADEEITSAVPEEAAEDAIAMVQKDTKTVFEAINASNFYEAFKQGAKDLSVSAFGMIVEDPGRGAPVRCQVVPLTELLILRAPDGGIGVRFWEQTVTVRSLPSLFPDIPWAKLPKPVRDKKDKKNATVRKTQGCWRDYSKPGVVAWHTITFLDDEPIEHSRSEGVGAASILVGRWDADAPFAWANGPGVAALPSYRALDEVEYLILKQTAKGVDPAVAYRDDGNMNLDDGLQNGALIPCLDEPAFQVIESAHPNSVAEGEAKARDLEHRIKRHYYVDEPEQEGLTPPTAAQWLDERLRRQRRLATPAASIWTEFLSEAFLRFRYLLVKRGAVAKEIKVGSTTVTLRAVNPLQRAAEMEEAASSLRFLQSVGALFGPALLPVAIDVGGTLHKLRDQSRATGITLKTSQEINDWLNKDAQLARVQQLAGAAGQSGVMPLVAAQSKGTVSQ